MSTKSVLGVFKKTNQETHMVVTEISRRGSQRGNEDLDHRGP